MATAIIFNSFRLFILLICSWACVLCALCMFDCAYFCFVCLFFRRFAVIRSNILILLFVNTKSAHIHIGFSGNTNTLENIADRKKKKIVKAIFWKSIVYSSWRLKKQNSGIRTKSNYKCWQQSKIKTLHFIDCGGDDDDGYNATNLRSNTVESTHFCLNER